MPRPRKSLPANGLDIIRQMARNGCQETKIAQALGLSFKTWVRLRKEDPEARAVWEEARAIEHDAIMGKLFQLGMEEDNAGALMFLMRARHGYRDQGSTDPADASRPIVNIVLPSPMRPEDYVKLIEASPEVLESP
jgi:hypothetical protein